MSIPTNLSHLHFRAAQASVLSILRHADAFEWTVQGFGMMRTYLDRNEHWRLNIWDNSLTVPHVSVIHNHPWNFESWIIKGSFTNQRYKEHPPTGPYAATHNVMSIRTGEGGGLDGPIDTTCLIPLPPEHYSPTGSHFYRQYWAEVHQSKPANGTVTLNYRTNRPESRVYWRQEIQKAKVYWPLGQYWVSAEPRAATQDEIVRVIENALRDDH